jgi:thiosulfate dehydrogenase
MAGDPKTDHREPSGRPENAPGEGQTSTERVDLAVGPSLSFAIVVVITVAIIGAGVSLIFSTFVTARPIPPPASQEAMKQYQVPQGTVRLTFNPPPLNDAPNDIRGAVQRGYRILMNTRKEVPQHVGGKLDCRNCHFEGGMVKKTLSLVGVAAKYPKYGSRETYSVDLVERTNSCFERSCNGKALPPDGKDMQAMMAYYHWISKGIPIYADVPWLGLKLLQSQHKPDPASGAKLYADECAGCHGPDGQGTQTAPPLWGAGSFNDGAEMSHTQTLAAFAHAFMPKGNPVLTVDQALDIAAYVTSRPRPHFKGGNANSPSTGGSK